MDEWIRCSIIKCNEYIEYKSIDKSIDNLLTKIKPNLNSIETNGTDFEAERLIGQTVVHGPEVSYR